MTWDFFLGRFELPYKARVQATNGLMSTLEFLRLHAQDSPSGRDRAPSTAAASSGVPRWRSRWS